MRVSLICGLILVAQTVGRADDPKPVAKREFSPSEAAFVESVKSAQNAVREAKAYAVSADGKWRLSGGKIDATGTSHARMVAGPDNRFRITVSSSAEQPPHLVIASDGRSITRYFADGPLYSVSPCTETPLVELQADGVTVAALRSAGVDFLARPDMLSVLSARTLAVEDLGIRSEQPKVHGYRLTMAGGQSVIVRFAVEGKPVPVEVASTTEVPIGDKTLLTRTLDVALKWTFDTNLGDDEFALPIPDNAEKVSDLAEAIFASDANEFLGRPLPAAEFAGLDGKPVRLGDYKGKSAVVLYAWATWAAPSVDDLPNLHQLVTEYTPKGVTFVAVNAGESKRAVREFAEKAKFDGVIALDPKGVGLATVRMPTVPGVLVIDKEGMVRKYYRGKPDTAERVKADLDKLLRDEPLDKHE